MAGRSAKEDDGTRFGDRLAVLPEGRRNLPKNLVEGTGPVRDECDGGGTVSLT